MTISIHTTSGELDCDAAEAFSAEQVLASTQSAELNSDCYDDAHK